MSTEDKLKNVSPTFGNTVLHAVVGSQTKYRIVYADPAWTFKTYSEKGKLIDEHIYKNGQFEGLASYYDGNGNKMYEGKYVNGKQ